MIRINLLPREEKAQRRQSPGSFKAGEWLTPVLIIVGALVWIMGTALSQNSSVTSLERSIAEIDAQSRALAPQIERVNRLAQERAELDLRLGIISKLEKGRTSGVRMMDELESRIHLEALALAFPVALLVVFTAGLLDLAGFHGEDNWDLPRLFPLVLLPYWFGLFRARKKYM